MLQPMHVAFGNSLTTFTWQLFPYATQASSKKLNTERRKAYLYWDCISLLASKCALLEHSLCPSLLLQDRPVAGDSQDCGSCLGSKATGQKKAAMMQCRLRLPHSRAEGRLLTHQGHTRAQGSQISSYEIIHIKFLQEGKVWVGGLLSWIYQRRGLT